MDGFLRVDTASTLPTSPSSSYLADEVASICPLITPSPPTNDLINPPPESTESAFTIGDELATKLQHVQDDEKAESASSSSSALAEPACAQLLNHRNVYHHITKTEESESQETNGKTQPLQLTFRNPPDNYFFMSWNWPLIRKGALWLFMSGLVAMVSLVVAMISTLPRTCNPSTEWYQGSLFYEIFPASFYSSKGGMHGDLKGIGLKAHYLHKMGVKAIRLNSIFNSSDYPLNFEEVPNLTDIATTLGTIQDFKNMTDELNKRNISVILDLPIYPYIKKLPRKKNLDLKNTSVSGSIEFFRRPLRDEDVDIIEYTISYWIKHGVEGFYLKGLEHLVDDSNLVSSLRTWKRILGQDKILIVNDHFINSVPLSIMNIVLNNVDLVDIKLNLLNDTTAIIKQINSVQNGTLFSKPGMPWVHWSLSSVNSQRLANILPHGNATLGATLLQLMLPGTPSIFYGDEIGLKEIIDEHGDSKDVKHLHQLTMMPWPRSKLRVLSWMHGKIDPVHFEQAEVVKKMVALRMESPSIYMNAVYKEGVNKANAEVKYAKKKFLLVQRWYPRRKAYVVACNLGEEHQSIDLSTLLYSGEVVVGPNIESKLEVVSFKDLSLSPGESVIISLN